MSTDTHTQQCGGCRYYDHNKRWCKRYPPVPVDNRHARFPFTHWDETCGEWQARPGGAS